MWISMVIPSNILSTGLMLEWTPFGIWRSNVVAEWKTDIQLNLQIYILYCDPSYGSKGEVKLFSFIFWNNKLWKLDMNNKKTCIEM